MKVVIEIPEEIYDHAKDFYNRTLTRNEENVIRDSIADSTPLPIGHGRLIDADKFLKNNEAYTGWILDSSDWGGKNAYKDALEDLVNEAPTIIEADGGGEDDLKT